MLLESDQGEFDPASFSVREREVVDMVVLGHTDEQISQALDIPTSTVNSYWVRIRGKIGQLSRTEIVAKMLHAGYREERRVREAEIMRLTGLLGAANAALAGAEGQLAAAHGVDWHLLALHFASEALMIANGPGDILYANLQAERLFSCDPGALVGRAICELTVPQGREKRRARILQFMESDAPGRLALGVREPCFAHPESDDEFRITMVMKRFDIPSGPMAVVTVKEFLADAEEIIRSLRKPITLE
jgi:DNA-binding CsgD family transcriptional regulator